MSNNPQQQGHPKAAQNQDESAIPKEITCWNWVQGVCTSGSTCLFAHYFFSHTAQRTGDASKKHTLCLNEELCRWPEDACSYSHDRNHASFATQRERVEMLVRRQPWEVKLVLRCKECPESQKFETTETDEMVRHCQERHGFLGSVVKEEEGEASGGDSGGSGSADGSGSSSDSGSTFDYVVERRRSV